MEVEREYEEEIQLETVTVDISSVGEFNLRVCDLNSYWRNKYFSCQVLKDEINNINCSDNRVGRTLERWPMLNDLAKVPQIDTGIFGRRDTAEEIPHGLKIEKVNKELSESKSVEQALEIDPFEPVTVDEAFSTLKKLAKFSQSERLKLRHCHIQGLLLDYINKNTSRKVYETTLELISMSKSYARSWIGFHRLTADYGKLLYCKRPIRYFMKTLKYIREVCQADPEEWKLN